MPVIDVVLMIQGANNDASVGVDGQGDLGVELVLGSVISFANAIRLGLMERIDMVRTATFLGQDLGHGPQGVLVDRAPFRSQFR